MEQKPRVLFVCGGLSGEHEISVISCKHVVEALDRNRFDFSVMYISKQGSWGFIKEQDLKSVDANPKNFKAPSFEAFQIRFDDSSKVKFQLDDVELTFDAAFSIIHGFGGEDGKIQGFFDSIGIPMVGSDVRSSALGIDKRLTKAICMQRDLPVVPFQDIGSQFKTGDLMFPYPVFVKPADEGSSLGVEKVSSETELREAILNARQWSDKVMVEPAVEGREIEFAVLQSGKEILASPAGEILCPQGEFYSYDAKYVLKDHVGLAVPAEIDGDIEKKGQHLAIEIFKALGCRGLARVDFFLTKDGNYQLNEINTMPGFTPISMYPKLIGLTGIGYSELITQLIEGALAS
jgi:D-alanine-D-alanine ligase